MVCFTTSLCNLVKRFFYAKTGFLQNLFHLFLSVLFPQKENFVEDIDHLLFVDIIQFSVLWIKNLYEFLLFPDESSVTFPFKVYTC